LLDSSTGLALSLLELVLLLRLSLFALEIGSALGQTALVRILGGSASGAPRLTLLG